MTKKYQTKTGDASALAVPEHVSVAMDEIAADEDVPSSVELRWRPDDHQAAFAVSS